MMIIMIMMIMMVMMLPIINNNDTDDVNIDASNTRNQVIMKQNICIHSSIKRP